MAFPQHLHWLSVRIAGGRLVVSFDRGWSDAVRIGFRSEVYEMTQGETREFVLENG